MNSNRKYLIITLVCVITLLAVLGFARKELRQVESLQVQIEKYKGNSFVTKADVIYLARGEENVLSLPVSKWDMSEMERRIETNPFIKDAQVFRDVKGHVLVQVTQRKPIARWYHRRGQDRYIDEEGNLLPTTGKYTARVPVVEIQGLDWEENLSETPYGKSLFEMLNFIESEKFWRAQIAHIIVRNDGQIEMTPQLSRQKIYFGMPGDFQEKFGKLMLFYKKILPVKGWNKYTTVNLKYKDQIICE